MPKKRIARLDLPEPITRNGVDIGFKPIDGPSPKSGIYYYDNDGNYQSLYPSVYSFDGTGYFKFWDHFTREYFIRVPLINSDQAWLYTFLTSIRNQGFRLSVMGRRKNDDDEPSGLAALLGRDRRGLTRDLDRLEDCLLIHRVRRLDLRGTPNDIIIHTPFRREELYEQGGLAIIQDRIAREATKTAREKKIKKGVDDDGRNYAYLDRSVKADDDGRFHYHAGQIAEAFGFHVARFTEFALTFFRKNWHFLSSDKSAFEHDYRDLLKQELDLYDIRQNARREKCYVAANKFRTIYCPSYEELLAV